jgi:hypothetical protein
MITAGGIFAAVSILRFFKGGPGETLADRGGVVEGVRPPKVRAACNGYGGGVDAIMLLCYSTPNT